MLSIAVRRLIAMCLSKASISRSAIPPPARGPPPPALLNMQSSRPNRSTACSTRAWTCNSSSTISSACRGPRHPTQAWRGGPIGGRGAVGHLPLESWHILRITAWAKSHQIISGTMTAAVRRPAAAAAARPFLLIEVADTSLKRQTGTVCEGGNPGVMGYRSHNGQCARLSKSEQWWIRVHHQIEPSGILEVQDLPGVAIPAASLFA